MDKQTELIHVFYEISMAIGRSLDLKIMLRQALTVFMKKLNCSAGGVFLYKKDYGSYELKDSFVIPRIYLKNDNYLTKYLGIDNRLEKSQVDKISAQLPLKSEISGTNCLLSE